MKKPPKGIGLYIRTLRSGEKKYESRLWNPYLQRIGKKKIWQETNLNDVLKLHAEFRKEYEANNFEIDSAPKDKPKYPELILECAALFEKYLHDDPSVVYAHKAKDLSRRYTHDTINYVRTFLECLKENEYRLSHTHVNKVNHETAALFYELLEQRFADGEIGPASYNHHVKAVHYWIKTLIREFGYDLENPFDGFKRKKKQEDPQFLEIHELHDLLDKITPENGVSEKGKKKKETVNYYRDWLKQYFILSAFIGGRPSEVARLTWNDVGEDYITLTTKKGGGSKSYVYIHPELATALAPMRVNSSSDNEYVLQPEWTNRNSLITFVSKAFTHFFQLTKIRKKVTFYNLRHTYINTLYNVIGESALSVHHKKDTAVKHYLSKKKKLELQEGKMLFDGLMEGYF
ncbi:tyrosine-type recombinase/integrase [Ekhidna sp.]|uniref:tyrosine-type recombinase/integrase n=1 Tax=Ekhidna sp. TaxID=2608089 RepID=UPI003B5A4C10